jgi:hypothetical protein
MALGTDTARLQTVLTLKDGLSPGLNKPIGTVGKFNKGMDSAGKKVGAFTGKLKTAGVVAGGALAGGLFVGIKSGLQNLGELESATTSVDAALRQMGKAGEVTAAQIADWANEIESSVDAAFDDKAITNATTTLLRFGRVTTKNIRPAMEVMTDLAAKTGDVDSAATLLARSLADPTKAAGKLARQGIILTEAQEKQIKAFVEAGDAAGAQAVLLDAVATSTKGAAAAMNGPYVDAQRKLDDAVEDGTKALAVGFLPLITEVSEELRKGVADPGTMDNIRNFGKGLAGAFKEGLAFAKKIPWGAIADGLKTSAQWAGKLFDAFRSLPPEMQATIVALAGLSKLTGGAPIKIAVDFAKEGLKGLFGRFFDRGSSAANALWVKQVGMPGGAAGAGGKGGIGALGKLFLVGELVTAGIAVYETWQGEMAKNSEFARTIHDDLKAGIAVKTPQELQHALDGVNQGINDIQANPLNVLVAGSALDELKAMRAALTAKQEQNSIIDFRKGERETGAALDTQSKVVASVNRLAELQRSLQAAKNAGDNARVEKIRGKIEIVKGRIDAAKRAVDANKATVTARSQIETARLNAIREKQQAGINAYRAGERATGAKVQGVSNRLNTANTRLAQIRAKRMSFSTSVNVGVRTSVSVRNVNNSNTTQNNYGSKTTNKVL